MNQWLDGMNEWLNNWIWAWINEIHKMKITMKPTLVVQQSNNKGWKLSSKHAQTEINEEILSQRRTTTTFLPKISFKTLNNYSMRLLLHWPSFTESLWNTLLFFHRKSFHFNCTAVWESDTVWYFWFLVVIVAMLPFNVTHNELKL